MANILVVEDNKNTLLLTTTILSKDFVVYSAQDGLQALDIVYNKQIDIIVSDITMPYMNGYELLKRLRNEDINIPVILLTAKESFEDKKEGFTLGSDDYLTKPVDYDELKLRIDAILRRANITSNRKIQLPTITIDSLSYSIFFNNENIIVPKKEIELLFKLLSYPDVIFTKSQLLDSIWGYETESSEDTIKTHINRLRNKFADCDDFEIITIKGLGYKAILNKRWYYEKTTFKT